MSLGSGGQHDSGRIVSEETDMFASSLQFLLQASYWGASLGPLASGMLAAQSGFPVIELPLAADRVPKTEVQSSSTTATLASVNIPVAHAGESNPAEIPTSQQDSSCQPGWLPAFGALDRVNHNVFALTVFDDGSGGGAALYAGGSFTTAGGATANRIAKWDGTSWSPLGSGMNGDVRALAVHDDGLGGGAALYAAGSFTTADGLPANRIAKWDGASWSPLGAGLNEYTVFALTVYDDGRGGGPALYAGGDFETSGSVVVNHIAKWNGTSWSSLGGGTMGGFAYRRVVDLAVFDDGSGGGAALYAAGEFTTAGAVAARNIAKWDGTGWSALGSGTDNRTFSLAVHDDGSGAGPALYVGGAFENAGGVPAYKVARWDGTSWSSLGNTLSASIEGVPLAMTVYDDGSGQGPALYAGGILGLAGGVATHHIAKWDGSSWSPLDSGVNGWVWALTVFDDGSGGTVLCAGGEFDTAGGVSIAVLRNGAGRAGPRLAER